MRIRIPGFLEREEFDLPVDLLEILLDGSSQIHFEHAEQQLIWEIILINTDQTIDGYIHPPKNPLLCKIPNPTSQDKPKIPALVISECQRNTPIQIYPYAGYFGGFSFFGFFTRGGMLGNFGDAPKPPMPPPAP